MNPLEWISWVYGKAFSHLNPAWWFVTICTLGLVAGFLLAAVARERYNDAQKDKGTGVETKNSPPPASANNKKEPSQSRPHESDAAIHESLPAINQQGQNNIAQIGNNNQAIINPKPPEPNIRWRIEDIPQNNPDEIFKFRIVMALDNPMDDPGFAALCDRPCGSTGAGIAGVSNTAPLSNLNNANEAFVVFNTPNPMPPDVEIYWIIWSKDNKPVKLLGLQRIPPETVKKIRQSAPTRISIN